MTPQQLNDLRHAKPMLWLNPDLQAAKPQTVQFGPHVVRADGLSDARSRLYRFRPLLAKLFPELKSCHGVIESPLLAAPHLASALGMSAADGALWVKGDHLLPVAGSIKARGGIHEVLEFAEQVAIEHRLLGAEGNYGALALPEAREVFARHQVTVGSTGNLGLSVGVMAAALGFQACVHMSADAKPWKKERLRNRGVQVIEHAGDYAQAVAAGREQAARDERNHFIDDENSLSLLMGYGAAAVHLETQLRLHHRTVDATHPLFVYLPCGVGGAPAGITLGLKQIYGTAVHCFFVEPVQSPSFLVQMAAPDSEHPTVYDVGLSNQTEADGLAVPQASQLARAVMRPLLSGCLTVDDDSLFTHLHLAAHRESIRLEPSAASGFSGPGMLRDSAQGQAYLQQHGLSDVMHQATHLVWTTGGLFVPEVEYNKFLQRGEANAAAIA